MEGAATAAVEVLVKTLINVSKQEISLIRGLDKDVEQLKTTLAMIQSYLNDAEKKIITHEAVKTWLKKLEEVAFDADNVLDELNYHILYNEVKKMKTVKHKVLSFFSSFDHIARPRNMALAIKQINEDFESLNQKATALRLESIFVSAPAAVPDAAFETDSFTVDPIYIGRDDDAPKLVEMLTEISVERMFSVLAIVGMGGMGKTTLTRKVFNHEKIKTRFGSFIWVHVSQTFDPIILFKKILASFSSKIAEDESEEKGVEEDKKNEVTVSRGAISEKFKKSFKGKTDEVETRQDILEKLQQAMKSKTYLLVLDDVWNQDLHEWEDFVNSLSGVTTTKGNGIIMSTRNSQVASIVNPFHIHHLNGLSDEDCWSIIKAKAFPNTDIVPSEFATIGVNIARRCQGLPLAANVVGGVLRDKSGQEWLSIQHKWLSDVEGDNISKILRLSFKYLSSPSLKKCFAYCSIFPKGDRIVKQELIELWMAEGFLQPDQRNDMESVGDKFVNALLQNSLLQVADRDDYGNVESCGMHDLVHDIASSVLSSSDDPNGINQGRQHYGYESSPIAKERSKYLRTLFRKGEISDINFSHFKCLHALTLLSYQVKELPSSIKELIHLRSLNTSKTNIKSLPESIGELHYLQTIRVNNRSYSMKLPSTFKYLINLRHLYIGEYVKLPSEIGRLTSLQTLTHFTVGDEKGCLIEELGSLKNLKGNIKIRDLEKVHGKEEAEKANICQKSNLFELRFHWSRRRGGGRNDENVLEGLQPHPNLNKLEIDGFQGKRFPLWTLKMAVQDEPGGSWVGLYKLMEITLKWCEECEEIPTMGHLPNLKSLYLEGLKNVKIIKSSFCGIEKETSIMFPALERLTLYDMYGLREWAEAENGANNCEVKAFPQLQYLKIQRCEQLMKISSICGVKVRSMREVWIDGLDGLESLPDLLFHNNQDLMKLRIEGCPRMRELPDGLDTLNSLEELNIRDCPNLTSIASGCSRGQSQGVLRGLQIERCLGLMELPREMVESWAPSLEILSLAELSSLKNVAMVTECVAKSSRLLRELRILGVPNLMATCSHRPDHLELNIRDCPNLTSIASGCSRGQSQGVLRGLQIERCLRLMELPREMVESWAPSLEILSLAELSSLKNVAMVTECVAKSSRLLRELRILGVPNLMATCSVESWAFRSLRELSIDVSINEGSNSVGVKQSVDGILQGCSHSLTRLNFKGMEIWEFLPESIQNLTALSQLRLWNSGMEQVPEWFGKLSSLRVLGLHSCNKLRRVDALGRLTELRLLHIEDCPELQRMDSREWRKTNPFLFIFDDRLIGESCSESLLDCIGRCIG